MTIFSPQTSIFGYSLNAGQFHISKLNYGFQFQNHHRRDSAEDKENQNGMK